MTKTDIENLRYPKGRYVIPELITKEKIETWIAEIDAFPTRFGAFAQTLSEEELNSPYREGGWTGQQVIHHVADSHLNAYIRTKLALTEDSPTISPYREELWAEMRDSKDLPVKVSLHLIENIHLRWVHILKRLDEKDFERVYIHPAYGRTFPLGEVLALYAWHGAHHLGHLELIKAQ